MVNHPNSVCYFTVGNAFIGIVSDRDTCIYFIHLYNTKEGGALSYSSCPP